MWPNLLLSFVLLLGASLDAWQPNQRAFAAPTSPATSAPAVYRPGAVLVGFRSGAAKLGASALAAAGLEVTQEIHALGIAAVAAPVGQEAATARRLAALPGVAYAELDYQARAQLAPNDPLYNRQWGLNQVGAEQAWSVVADTSSTVIAVVDTGLDLGHPDLAANVWRNAGEVPQNGRDDDGNGYVDDAQGWRFYHARSGIGYEARGDPLVDDDNGHGTHVAGIAGAVTNNAIGVAGMARGSPLMAVKVLDSAGYGWYSDIAAGIVYAAKNGADVINLSLGGPEPSQALCDAVSFAAHQGKVVVAAAGNSEPTVAYPAMCPGALAVAASDASDARATFSNSGPRIDLAAPGVDILSTYYWAATRQHIYLSASGTSGAAPLVSGTAALVWSRWPTWTGEAVGAQLLATAKDVTWPGRDDGTGWGRLDAAAALGAPAQDVDLQLSGSVFPPTVVAGNPLTVTFAIVNAGPGLATSVTLQASLPAEPTIDNILSEAAACRLAGAEMTCGLNRLAAGASITVSVVMTPTQVGNGALLTGAAASAAQRELTPADNGQAMQNAIRPMLSGRVFLDGNGDGIRQAWETRGISDAPLFLEQSGHTVALMFSLGQDGAYAFNTLALGTYVLSVQLPTGYQLTTPGRIALTIQPAQETVVYFGAYTGTVEPDPTMTPTATPTATPGPPRTYLPLIVY